MATGIGVTKGKTGFVNQFLRDNPDATWKSVNEAWKAAGNADQISESLVYKSRAEQGLNTKRSPTKVQVKAKSNPSLKAKAKSAAKVAAPKAKAAAQPTPQPVVSESASPATPKSVAPAPAAKNVSVRKVAKEPQVAAPAAAAAIKHAAHQAQVVDEVESGIDELIFNLKSSGGNPEVEAALRAARRLLLTRQHGE